MSECTCSPTDLKTWTRYGDAVEPRSTMEPEPDCPEHFPNLIEDLKEAGVVITDDGKLVVEW